MAQHISIRVPWKDNGYTGLICNKPCFNTACTRLKNIASNKDDSKEELLAGQIIKGHEEEIPCLSEGGCFMSEETFTKTTIHPYKKNNPSTHGHFLPTDLTYPPFSLPARPFGWTMLSKVDGFGNKIYLEELAEKKGIVYDPDIEHEIGENLGWKTNWVQDATNQREIFKIFYQNVEVDRSLVITYAKQVPFIEDSKRVVTGIGFVKSVVPPPEHNHTDAGELRSILWETMIEHSIRNDRKNGFLLPYKEMMEYAEKHPDFDITSIAVLNDDESFDEFSYATEHLSHDTVITVLLKIIKSLQIIKDCIPGNWSECIRWCKARLEEVWLNRGPFPGLGAMLTAVGFKHGSLIAGEIKKKIQDYSNFEDQFYILLESSKANFSKQIASDITGTKVGMLKNLSTERKKLFWLLARINLTEEQAIAIYNLEKRDKYKILCKDIEILENPYTIFERTRNCKPTLQISVNKIDMAMFPADIISDLNPVPEPSAIESGDDKRRIRAFAVQILEVQADNGHTVYPQFMLVDELNSLPLEIECDVTSDVIDSIVDFLENEIILIPCEDGRNAFQLKRLNDIDNYIRHFVDERLNSKRFDIKEDWQKIVNDYFDKLGNFVDENEKKARREKAAILQELANSSFSVLIGGAGTGKTTLLSLLCKSDKIKDGGILLLAPTGKARVKISKTMCDISHSAFTIAQFLVKNNRFDGNTMTYMMSNKDAKDVPETVIIDESSMMTEEMFGALLSALPMAKRIIFVGDPNQLPPIGAGRPFVDLVKYLKKNLPKFPNPQVSEGFGELTITRRQSDDGKSQREDLKVAEWFKESSIQLDDDIFADLQGNKLGAHILFKKWTTPEDLQQKIFETICEVAKMKDINDKEGFDISLGGMIDSGWMNFGSFPSRLDSWQILSAYKNDEIVGSATINRLIHEKYRSKDTEILPHCKKRKTPSVLGFEGIVYGDKVINVRNQTRNQHSWPDGWLYYEKVDENEIDDIPENPQFYVANGEVGIVEQFKFDPTRHLIRFNSQPLYNYSWNSYISEEGNNDIELAYALTVHKAQGSEFDTVILVLNEPSRMLSRELLYTALTRQKDKIFILYNDEAYKLKNYSSVIFSDIARRFTCLFKAPHIVEHIVNNKKQFYENSLIHRTKRGEMVRSKSEVIIANMLFDAEIDYSYEVELPLKNGRTVHPDFTIYRGGRQYYWEHLGMLYNEDYRRKWNLKYKAYEDSGFIEGDNLIITKDGEDGSLDSKEIEKQINKYFK